MNFLQAEIPLDWDENSLLIPSKKGTAYTGPLKIPYTCEDGVLKISTRAYSMDFNALSDEEQADYEANGSGTLGGAANMIVQGLLGGMEGGLAESLLFDLALGMMGSETEPIPEGEPSKGPVTGTVDGMEFTVLGTDSLQYEGEEYIVFYYDAVNVSDQLNAVWTISTDAAQDGELLEEKWDVPEDVIPERVNANYEVYPGRTIRCADIYHYDPDGGPVGFRILSYENNGQVLYYADPKNMTGAPAKPFVFDSDPSVPEELAALPEETKNVRIEDAEFFTDEDGSDAVRFYFSFPGDSDPYFYTALQDGIELPIIFKTLDLEEAAENKKAAAEEGVSTYACKLRTKSPVVFTVFEDKPDGTKIFEAAKIVEIK